MGTFDLDRPSSIIPSRKTASAEVKRRRCLPTGLETLGFVSFLSRFLCTHAYVCMQAELAPKGAWPALASQCSPAGKAPDFPSSGAPTVGSSCFHVALRQSGTFRLGCSSCCLGGRRKSHLYTRTLATRDSHPGQP